MQNFRDRDAFKRSIKVERYTQTNTLQETNSAFVLPSSNILKTWTPPMNGEIYSELWIVYIEKRAAQPYKNVVMLAVFNLEHECNWTADRKRSFGECCKISECILIHHPSAMISDAYYSLKTSERDRFYKVLHTKQCSLAPMTVFRQWKFRWRSQSRKRARARIYIFKVLSVGIYI